MATPKPIELFFVSPIYARGEHLIGENAHSADGKVNMVHIKRGEKRLVHNDPARDLIIAKQAADVRNANDLAEAKQFVREFEEVQQKQLSKKAA